ncbi:hypothetical protein [Thiolapillus sp.]|uniref:hypothetical protein n=2 Tax=Thiolapillus sp. TaxID=2017437 RepID=UPI0025F97EC4|nr:hypothetical protein [Thiolapillus sp.]
MKRCRLMGFHKGPFMISQILPTTAPTSLTPDGAIMKVAQELASTMMVRPEAFSSSPRVRCTHFRLP